MKKVIKLLCVISIVICLITIIITFILNSQFLDVLSFIAPLRISIGAILIPDIIFGKNKYNKEK